MKRNRLYVLGCGLLLTVSCIGSGAAGELVYAGVQDTVQLEASAIVDTMTGVEEQNLDSGEGKRNTLGEEALPVEQPGETKEVLTDMYDENEAEGDTSEPVIEEDFLDVAVDESQLHLEVNRAFLITLDVSKGEPPYQIYEYNGPEWAFVRGTEILGTPNEPGEYSFSYKVRDANGKTSTELDVTFVVGEEVGTIPEVKLPSDDGVVTLVVGEAFKLPLEVTGGTPPFTYEFHGAPDWMKIEGDYLVGKPDKVYDEFLIGLGVADANSLAGNVREYTIKMIEKEPEKLPDAQDEKKGSNTAETSSHKIDAVQTRDAAPIGRLAVTLLAAYAGAIAIIKGKKGTDRGCK